MYEETRLTKCINMSLQIINSMRQIFTFGQKLLNNFSLEKRKNIRWFNMSGIGNIDFFLL